MTKTVRKHRRLLLSMIIMVLITGVSMAYAAGQSSANYAIESDVISGGGGDAGSANYDVFHTTGQSSALGKSLSSNYNNYGGFWHTIISVTVSRLKGDIDENNDIDISDVILVLRIALGLDGTHACANIDDNSGVDISDVVLTLRMALGLDPLQSCTIGS